MPSRVQVPIYKKQKSHTLWYDSFILVRVMGLEPIRRGHTPLKRACLPIPAHSHIVRIFQRSIIISFLYFLVNSYFVKFTVLILF